MVMVLDRQRAYKKILCRILFLRKTERRKTSSSRSIGHRHPLRRIFPLQMMNMMDVVAYGYSKTGDETCVHVHPCPRPKFHVVFQTTRTFNLLHREMRLTV